MTSLRDALCEEEIPTILKGFQKLRPVGASFVRAKSYCWNVHWQFIQLMKGKSWDGVRGRRPRRRLVSLATELATFGKSETSQYLNLYDGSGGSIVAFE